MRVTILKPACVLFITFLLCGPLFSLDMEGVIAYPVPLNPNRHQLTLHDKGTLPSVDSIKVEIFDINGDLVLARSYGVFPITWNGRNGSGKMVKPGLYIIKVTAEDAAGGYGKKIIRILVDY